MTTDTDLMTLLGPQFSALADALDQAGPAILDGPSLCAGWSAGNVLAHVTMAARYDQESFGRELAAAGFDFETLSQTIAARDAQLPFASLLGDLRSETMASWTPPGGGAIGALTHVVIHGLDITAANDLPRTADDAAATAVLEALTTGGVSEAFGRSTSGQRLRATDLDFSFGEGDGPVLEATAADLILALSGRDRPGLAVPHVAQPGAQEA